MKNQYLPAKTQALRFFLAATVTLTSLQAFSATFTLEGYRYNSITRQLSEIGHNVDVYANGSKIISDGLCTQKEPCKTNIPNKSTLTICSKSLEGICQTGIKFDPSDSQSQRFAYVFSSTYESSYTVYRPEEMPVIDGFLKKQGEDEKLSNEMLNKNLN